MLNRRFSASPKQYQSPSRIERQPELNDESVHNPYDPATNSSVSPPHRHSSTKKLLHVHDGTSDFTPPFIVRQRSVVGRQELRDGPELGEPSSAAQMRNSKEHKTTGLDMSTPRPGLGPRPVGGQMKLGTFSGVFVPTCLNVLSIVMFPRFGFILGQGGVLGMMGKL
jgi:potassium/chloride transporter 9